MTTDYRRMNGGIVGLPKGRTAELLDYRKDERPNCWTKEDERPNCWMTERTNWRLKRRTGGSTNGRLMEVMSKEGKNQL